MARMTATDFVGFLRKRMGNPTTDEWSNADLLRFVNLAQERIAIGSEIATLETTEDIAATSALGETYEVASENMMYITSVKNMTNGQRIKPTNRDAYTRDTQGSSVPTGEVYRYFESGLGSNDRKQITLQHKPDSAQTIRIWFLTYPTEMALLPTATSSELPREFDEAIMDISAEIGKKNDQQMREAQAERNMAKDTEGRAAGVAPMVPERRYGVESPIAPETRTRSTKGGRSR